MWCFHKEQKTQFTPASQDRVEGPEWQARGGEQCPSSSPLPRVEESAVTAVPRTPRKLPSSLSISTLPRIAISRCPNMLGSGPAGLRQRRAWGSPWHLIPYVNLSTQQEAKQIKVRNSRRTLGRVIDLATISNARWPSKAKDALHRAVLWPQVWGRSLQGKVH